MPLERLSSTEAFARLRSNPDSRWPDGRNATVRMSGIVSVGSNPSFVISKDDAVLTIGSCFAREIEKRLLSLGFDLPMTRIEIPREERVSETANDILNKYTIHSMANELRWAFEDPGVPYTDLFIEIGDGLWHDPHLAPNLLPAPFERVLARRREVAAAVAELARCKLIIVTLGLGEAWIDTKTNYYLNGAPPPSAVEREPDRFCLDVLSYDDIGQGLDDLYATIQKYAPEDFKILITVSPVPFKATFTGRDAIIANCYSKSVQRAACEAFVRKYDNVDYFPSYELVTVTERSTAYEVDNIHVRANVVARIMDTVVARYCENANPRGSSVDLLGSNWGKKITKAAVIEKFYTAKAKGQYELAVQVGQFLLRNYERTMSVSDRMANWTLLGVCMLRARHTAEGVEALRRAVSIDPSDARAIYKLGLGLARIGQHEEALVKFRIAATLAPNVADHHWRFGMQLLHLKRRDDALQCFRQALVADPDHQAAKAALHEHEQLALSA